MENNKKTYEQDVGCDDYTLTVSDLCKRYYVKTKPSSHSVINKNKFIFKDALYNVSFELKPGLYGLLGPNGAGKSTLMNIIACILKQDKGTVLWNGAPISELGIHFRRILGFMPQQQGMYPSFTGQRFLSYMCALKEIRGKSVEEEISRTAGLVNMTDALSKKLASYSGGMKQRLLLAAALLGHPRLLILDEPTAGLDPKERVRLREALAEMAQHKIIFMATHVVSDVESVADSILLLKNGSLIDQGPAKALIERYAPNGGLEDVYLKIFEEEDGL